MSNSAQSSSQNPEQHIRDLFARLPQEHQAAYQRLSLDQKRLFLQRLVQRENVQPPQSLRVFRPEFDRAAHDPLDPRKRYHAGIFVELDRVEESGITFHVTGEIMARHAMRYEQQLNSTPKASDRLHGYTFIGYVSKNDLDSGSIDSVPRSLPAPSQEQSWSFWGKTREERAQLIWCKEDGEHYDPGEKIRPVFKCTEWTHQLAIPALKQAGILHPA